jgi:hypothetical protein
MITFATATRIDQAYGIVIRFDDTIIDWLERVDALKKADVVIEYNGERHEYQLNEFLCLLGFDMTNHV